MAPTFVYVHDGSLVAQVAKNIEAGVAAAVPLFSCLANPCCLAVGLAGDGVRPCGPRGAQPAVPGGAHAGPARGGGADTTPQVRKQRKEER